MDSKRSFFLFKKKKRIAKKEKYFNFIFLSIIFNLKKLKKKKILY